MCNSQLSFATWAGKGWLDKPASKFSMVSLAIRSRVSFVALPKWGVMTMLRRQSKGWLLGSGYIKWLRMSIQTRTAKPQALSHPEQHLQFDLWSTRVTRRHGPRHHHEPYWSKGGELSKSDAAWMQVQQTYNNCWGLHSLKLLRGKHMSSAVIQRTVNTNEIRHS